jgi:eukaryotic-like serine/threonine-protein kinase
MFNRVILQATNGEQKGQEFVLENEADYTLGRSRDCSCVLNDPLCLVSRRHCWIGVHAPFVRIQDLGSRNGTQLNGADIGQRKRKLSRGDIPRENCAEHFLEDGDVLELAGYEFQVRFDSKADNSAFPSSVSLFYPWRANPLARSDNPGDNHALPPFPRPDCAVDCVGPGR